MEPIEVGRKAPAFTLPDQAGVNHALKDHAGTAVVLFFYPKDMTSGCTKEACAFRDNLAGFERAGVAVLGVSPQDVKSKAKFAEKESLNFPILADDDATICEKYGVWTQKSMYGRSFMGVARTTYLIGPDGTVAERWDKVKVAGHVEDVLARVKEL